jgi:hypothetical protein
MVMLGVLTVASIAVIIYGAKSPRKCDLRFSNKSDTAVVITAYK